MMQFDKPYTPSVSVKSVSVLGQTAYVVRVKDHSGKEAVASFDSAQAAFDYAQRFPSDYPVYLYVKPE